MLFLIRYAEIGKEPRPEKSKLRRDIEEMLRAALPSAAIRTDTGRLFLETEVDATEIIANIHGISSFSPCISCLLEDLEPRVVALAGAALRGKRTFAVKVKRVGEHTFSSRGKAAELGSAICGAIPGLSVDLGAPDQTIHVEIRGSDCYLFDTILPGVDAQRGEGGAPIVEPRFLIDAMLGTLARRMRSLGFDAECHHDTSDSFLLRRSGAERRILLTQDRALSELGGPNAYFVNGKILGDQLKEVMDRFGLQIAKEALFTRCSICNALLEPVPKGEVADEVPPRAYAQLEEFYRCPACEKVYWKGSHYDQMLDAIEPFT